ncbi:MAG: 50S ribosomal protein L1 [Dehalococcoidales bacterium]|jgi:large subunit ribosomal protein L1|nr:50S ribosomal protein L1 [Dehalococcoidales bacterium]MDD3264927.1 50S ribosomal protein L1 [Dehalococcoidales bacterium]MDD4322153.1 50S ribosomal protein L1 [Dehalococcoidales bacterium]MDD4793724.1 50S ribosomal protein L1 [Dehalococcoidales bacterium]MDD5498137.1 50S ribosomal protein L1 [Dehalococcoidales bacterium]
MTQHSKRYDEALKTIDRQASYNPVDAIGKAKDMAKAKFDETVELHLRMGLDPRNSAQQVRGVALLPHGLGKTVRVLVFAQGEAVKIAETAGADYVGGEDLAKKIEGGWLEFDTAIATPDMMSKVGKLGKILGRKGLMPNPKAGTVVSAEDLPRTIEDARKGRVEFKLDRTAIIHVPVGKASFEADKLKENIYSVIDAILKAKPAAAKGQYIKSAFLTTTMGPGIKLDIKEVMAISVS